MEAESKTLEPPDPVKVRSALRRQAVTAMAQALAKKNFPETPWETMSPQLRKGLLENQLVAFDAQHGIVRVCSVEATDEMQAAANKEWDGRMSARSAGVWEAMSTIGDLTNQPG